MASETRWPREIVIRDAGRRLDVVWLDGSTGTVSAQTLRVESPSAEVQGHHPSQRRAVTGKEQVRIVAADPVGRYAVRLTFDDGHATGIYTWTLLDRLSATPAG
jgi:DUF971 family protein